MAPGAAPCSPGCTPDDDTCRVPAYARALLFFNPPITRELEQAVQLPLIPSTLVPALVQAAGAQFDPELGNLVVTGLDCDDARAAGISYTIRQHPDRVAPLYMTNGILSNSVSETDATGVGGFVGVPPGFVDILAHEGEHGLVGGVGVQVAASAISYATLAAGE